VKAGIVIVALAVACAGCAGPPAGAAAAPSLARSAVERLATAADQALGAAMAGTDATPLGAIFRDPALAILRMQAHRLAQMGVRIEDRHVVRQLVFFDARALEAVLAVESQHRVVSADEADPGWAAAARQWWMRFAFEGGAWWIIDQQDLPPDRWLVAR
jgi:hypothetical protein